MDDREARFAEKIGNEGSVAGPEVTRTGASGEQRDVGAQQIVAFGLDDGQQLRLAFDLYPEQIEQTLTVERVVQDVGMITLTEKSPVRSGRPQKDADLVSVERSQGPPLRQHFIPMREKHRV